MNLFNNTIINKKVQHIAKIVHTCVDYSIFESCKEKSFEFVSENATINNTNNF